jgi:hypothetical protein
MVTHEALHYQNGGLEFRSNRATYVPASSRPAVGPAVCHSRHARRVV